MPVLSATEKKSPESRTRNLQPRKLKATVSPLVVFQEQPQILALLLRQAAVGSPSHLEHWRGIEGHAVVIRKSASYLVHLVLVDLEVCELLCGVAWIIERTARLLQKQLQQTVHLPSLLAVCRRVLGILLEIGPEAVHRVAFWELKEASTCGRV